jgi:hypothetical protein
LQPLYRFDGRAGGQNRQEKSDIIKRIRSKWQRVPGRQVKKSDVLTWLASFKFGPPSYNLHLQTVCAVFRLAVDDRLIASNPVDGIRQKKLAQLMTMKVINHS